MGIEEEEISVEEGARIYALIRQMSEIQGIEFFEALELYPLKDDTNYTEYITLLEKDLAFLMTAQRLGRKSRYYKDKFFSHFCKVFLNVFLFCYYIAILLLVAFLYLCLKKYFL